MASIKEKIGSIKAEIQKVKWPKKQAALDATFLTVGLSTFVAIYLFVFDLGFSRILDTLTGFFGG